LILRGFVQLIPFRTSNIAGLIINILNSYISNNQDYAGIDKSKGEDFVVTGTLTAAAIYAAIVGDGNHI
jgi:hypothetical protein